MSLDVTPLGLRDDYISHANIHIKGHTNILDVPGDLRADSVILSLQGNGFVYHCISNNRIKKGVCPGAFIFEKELLDTLADMIQEQLDATLGQYSLGLENLSKKAEEQKNMQAKISSRKQEIQQLRTYQRGLYEGLIQNHLSKDEYFTFKEKYDAKIEAISKEIEQLKAGLEIIAKQMEQYKMLSQDAQHIKEDRQMTGTLIYRLIDRVEVSREKRITVHFRFQSEFEHCEEVLSQCRNM